MVTIPQQKPILRQPQDLGILQHLTTNISTPSSPQAAGGWMLALSPGALGAMLGWAGQGYGRERHGGSEDLSSCGPHNTSPQTTLPCCLGF